MNYLKNKLRFWIAMLFLLAAGAAVWYLLAYSQVPDLNLDGTLVLLETERMMHA